MIGRAFLNALLNLLKRLNLAFFGLLIVPEHKETS